MAAYERNTHLEVANTILIQKSKEVTAMLTPAVSTVKCPNCRQQTTIYETPADDCITITCPACKEPFTINLRTMRVIARVGNNETRLMNRLTCPRCKKGFILCESRPDAIVSDRCGHCGCYFRGNFKYLKTWESKPQPNSS